MTAVADWGVEIRIPENAKTSYQAEASRFAVDLRPCPAPPTDELAPNSCIPVVLTRVASVAPATLADAMTRWDGETKSAMGNGRPDVPPLDRGTTDNGVFYTVRTFRVRVGFNDGLGHQIHTFRGISRALAVLPLAGGSRVDCTGYVEHEVMSMDDADIKAVRDVCVSMRLKR